MIRGGWGTRRIARLLACACMALAAVPAVASAQSAVDEYSLDIPGGGGSGSESGAPPSDPAATGSSATPSDTSSGTTATGESGSGAGGGEGKNQQAAKPGGEEKGENLRLDGLHEDSGPTRSLDTSTRSAPEVVADTLLDSAMLPLLAVLAVITGAGAWRVLRGRRTLSGQAG